MYLITCKKCDLQYAGNTVTSFRLRFKNFDVHEQKFDDEIW